ncbi:hypothetical protein KFL_001090150 [Klebsormidium nitens]|uniref:MYND-type domain-containing protein n=1 Tax=Klebsormidium nitens TaxID=105231 RepID=A0A1Y1I0R9_KLENI|nr:hypothetical protein KFL_001090150 [Klebsormidium nitens]|eukprot:GAQ82366.1 hypothetical protein KFL_001090150 [Klebsormidium nitens]
MTPAERAVGSADVRVRRLILRTLPRFFILQSVREQTGKSTIFLNAVMSHALNHFQDLATLRGSTALLLSLAFALSEPALEDNLFRVAGRVLFESKDTMVIKFTITMLRGIERTRLGIKGFLSKPLAPNPTLRSAALALVLCSEQLDDKDRSFMVVLARALEYGTMVALADPDKCPLPGLSSEEDIRRLANADPCARQRAHELRTLLAKGVDADGDFCVRFVRANASKDAGMVEQEVEKMGIKRQHRKMATRCSRPGCDKVETRPRDFQLCGSCKLAVYCGRECQRRAWKAGHKDTCQKTG